MNQITITREEFRQKITENPRGFGYLAYLHDNPNNGVSRIRLALEEIQQMMTIAEIEEALFGKDEKD